VAAERQRERADDHDEHFQHAVIVAVLSPKFNSDEFWRASTVKSGVSLLVTRDSLSALRFALLVNRIVMRSEGARSGGRRPSAAAPDVRRPRV
jgi:hypothetical protein